MPTHDGGHVIARKRVFLCSACIHVLVRINACYPIACAMADTYTQVLYVQKYQYTMVMYCSILYAARPRARMQRLQALG